MLVMCKFRQFYWTTIFCSDAKKLGSFIGLELTVADNAKNKKQKKGTFIQLPYSVRDVKIRQF